jgi:Family of unknown function (DUF6194)
MDESLIVKYVTETFAKVHVETLNGNFYFFYDPDRKFTFATLMTNDDNDNFSNLNRSSMYRLNVGISRTTYQSMFGSKPSRSDEHDTTFDFTTLDQFMPHPVYGQMSWVCVLNPSAETFKTVQSLLAEAYDLDVIKYAKQAARNS